MSIYSLSNTYILNYNDTEFTGNTLRVRCLSSTFFDEMTIVKLYDGPTGENGIDSVVGYLTAEVDVVESDYDGTGYDLTGLGGTFVVFEGITDKTTSATFSVTSTNPNYGLKLTIGASTGIFYLEDETDPDD